MRHRRSAAQGQGEGQELHRPERRRQRLFRRVSRRQLPDQQLPWPGRNPEPAGQPGQRQPHSSCSASPSPTCATVPSMWASRSSTTSRISTPPRTIRLRPGLSANLTSAQQSLTQNYNQASNGLNFSSAIRSSAMPSSAWASPIRWTKSTITAFSTASQTFFQTISFRSGIQGSNALAGIINSNGLVQLHLQHHQQPAAPAQRQGIHGGPSRLPASGATCAISRPWWPTSASSPCTTCSFVENGRNVLGSARSWVMCRASAATWLRPTTASTPAARRYARL
jgi:hypothetical protein